MTTCSCRGIGIAAVERSAGGVRTGLVDQGAVHAALAFHMAAVFCCPFAFATNGPQMEAPLTDAVMPLFRRYLVQCSF